MSDKNKTCDNCPHINAKDVLKYLSKRPETERRLVTIFGICAVILSFGAACGIGWGISAYVAPVLNHILPASLQINH